MNIRLIKLKDNAALATIVRNCLEEHDSALPGTVYFDPTTDHLHELFQHPKSVYLVAELDGKVLGGCGIYPTDGLEEDTAELVKMYLLPEVRGIGLGNMLIDDCLERAKKLGFKKIYIESLPKLSKAIALYERKGWQHIDAPLGNSSHTGCNVWMLKTLGK